MTRHVISLGAGVQSSTMALMAAHGELTPMPDCAIFALVSESRETYEYLLWMQSVLPFRVHVACKGLLEKDILAAGPEKRVSNPPFFTDTGMLSRKCTADYKVAAIKRKLRELLQPGEAAVQWIGISTDEAARMKPSDVKYSTHRWPLIEAGMSRWDCLQWLTKNGYTLPPKSACPFCPYHDDKSWRDMKLNDPESFAIAVKVDKHIRQGLSGTTQKIYVHRSAKPLDEVDFRNAEDMGQLSMFDNECEGMCGI